MKKRSGSGKNILAGMMVIAFALSGCSFAGLESKTPQTPTLPPPPVSGSADAEQSGEKTIYYTVEDTLLPNDAEDELELLLKEDEWIEEGWGGRPYYCVTEDKACRAWEITRMLDEEEIRQMGLAEGATVSCGRYIQYMEAPFEKSVFFRVDGKWDDDEKQYEEQSLLMTRDGRMMVLLKPTDTKDKSYPLGEVKRDGSCVIVPETERVSLPLNLDAYVDPTTQRYRTILKTVRGGLAKPVYAYGENEELYFSDSYALWRYGEDDEEPVCVLEYGDRDIVFEELHKICVTKDGYALLTESRGRLRLLWLMETEVPVVQTQKQEVTVAMYMISSQMQDAATEFNRKSSEYRVVLQETPESGHEGYENYKRDLQMQLAAGKGPDILFDDVVANYEGAVQNGYLAPVDTVLESGIELLPGAKNGRMADGVHYGVPMKAAVYFLAGGQSLLGGRDRWTTEEMMKAVEKSGAKYLCFDTCSSLALLNGEYIVYYMGLFDDKATTYIDWENGESHLTEEPFLRLLEFSKKYAGKREDLERGEWGTDGHGLGLRDGEIAFDIFSPRSLEYIQWYEEVFEGKQAFTSFPGGERSGVYLSVDYCYLNASAQCPEGAKEFLQFLLSKEGQEIFTTGKFGSGFPVRWDMVEANLERAKKRLEGRKNLENLIYSEDGISYQPHLLTDEECEIYRKLLFSAEPYETKAEGIRSILDEELEPYFSGDRSAKEAARILDNRVQLYLDERK